MWAWITILCGAAAAGYLLRFVESKRALPSWLTAPLVKGALRFVDALARILAISARLMRIYLSALLTFISVGLLTVADNLWTNGNRFEAVAFGGVAVMMLVLSFGLFALRSNWHDSVPAPTLAELDANTLRALQDRGIDLTQPVSVDIYLYFPTEDAARQAAVSAATPTLTTCVKPHGESLWLCRLSGTLIASLSTMRELTTRLSAIAASMGGEYDGFGLSDDGTSV